jgi:hypothetical protein
LTVTVADDTSSGEQPRSDCMPLKSASVGVVVVVVVLVVGALVVGALVAGALVVGDGVVVVGVLGDGMGVGVFPVFAVGGDGDTEPSALEPTPEPGAPRFGSELVAFVLVVGEPLLACWTDAAFRTVGRSGV